MSKYPSTGMHDEVRFDSAVAEWEEQQRGDSHRELNPEVFHPSYIGCCKRQGFIRKLGLSRPDAVSLGVFRAGIMIHELMEDEISKVLPDRLLFEKKFRTYTVTVDTDDGEVPVTVTGRADCIDPETGCVYDFKSRGGWYRFDGVKQKNYDQLLLYMKGFRETPWLAADDWTGQLVYVSKKKPTSPEDVRMFPEEPGKSFEFNPQRFRELMNRAAVIQKEARRFVTQKPSGRFELDEKKLREEGIPFAPCGECYPCQKAETLVPWMSEYEGGEQHE